MDSEAARTPVRGLLAVIATATCLGLLTGCSPATVRPTGTATATASTPAIQSASPSAPAGTPSAPARTSQPATSASSSASTIRTDPDAPPGQCADAALRVSVQYDPQAAGMSQRGSFVVFRNVGSASCSLEGTPGLSLVGDGDGTQIGRPAARSTQDARQVSIPAGGYALAGVVFTAIDRQGGPYGDGEGHDPACEAEPADGYRVYPPHSFRAYFSAFPTYACSTDVQWISVGPVRPASDFSYFTPKS